MSAPLPTLTAMSPDDLARAGLRLDLDLDGALATVTLDRPEKRNAQTPTMWRALAALGADLPGSVRVVVLRGAGASFSAGLDRSLLLPGGAPDGVEAVGDLFALDDAAMAATIADYQAGFTWLHDPRFVSVAAVHGHAIGAGFQLALACDLRVVTDDVGFSMKESVLGLVPDLAGTKPLVEAVGYARALELCATARTVQGPEAVAIGLALRSVPADALDGAVQELVAALLGPAPEVVTETKALLQGAAGRGLAEQCRLEREAQVRRFRALGAGGPG